MFAKKFRFFSIKFGSIDEKMNLQNFLRFCSAVE